MTQPAQEHAMSRTFNLYLTGKTINGRRPEEVATALAALMKIPPEQALQLVAGKETAIKRGLDGTALHRYLEAFQKAGAETRKEEVQPVVDPNKPVTIACPACGTEQAESTICIGCGTNMAAWRAAKAEAAKRPPKPVPEMGQVVRSSAAVSDEEEVPRYRRSLLLEIGMFLVVTPLWGWLAMTDKTRGKPMRIFALVSFLIFTPALVLQAGQMAGLWDFNEGAAVEEAYNYGIDATNALGAYAVTNQRLALRSESIDWPAGKPASVQALALTGDGALRITLGPEAKKAAGAVITFTPHLSGGTLDWRCEAEPGAAKHLGGHCG